MEAQVKKKRKGKIDRLPQVTICSDYGCTSEGAFQWVSKTTRPFLIHSI